MDQRHIIGQVEEVKLPEINARPLAARIDTGARTSAIWVTDVHEVDDGLSVTFLGIDHEHFTDQPIVFKEFSKATVLNSTGVSQERFKIKLLVLIDGRRIRAWFTLADRSKQTYPVLIGRNILRGKFMVDVSKKQKTHSPGQKSSLK